MGKTCFPNDFKKKYFLGHPKDMLASTGKKGQQALLWCVEKMHPSQGIGEPDIGSQIPNHDTGCEVLYGKDTPMSTSPVFVKHRVGRSRPV